MHIDRRRFCCGSAAVLAGLTTSRAFAADDPACDVYTRERQAEVTPEAAIELLKAGNARFVAGESVNCDLMAQARATADGQAPFAAVVGCLDSRGAPELVFDQRIGDIFVARIAGNFVNTDIIGSLEFATAAAGAKAIVVLAHTRCGAIQGAIDNVVLGNLTATLANITPAVAATPSNGDRTSADAAFVEAVADTNAALAVRTILSRSAVIRDLVDAGDLAVVAAKHDLATGKVTFFPPV
jgi:carbonic anhydrase